MLVRKIERRKTESKTENCTQNVYFCSIEHGLKSGYIGGGKIGRDEIN